MKTNLIYTVGVAFLISLIFPYTTGAQTYNDGASLSTSTHRDTIRHYRRQSSETQQKMSALGSVATTNVIMPVLFGVTLKNISPNFGDPRSNGRTHEGEDIMAVKGTPIISPTSAVVLRVGTGPSEGLYVYTANPGGETFVYMHLDRIGEGVEEGKVLSQGSLIGYVGNTGNASGGAAHLHFEIHDSEGVAINPFPRLTVELTPQEKISYLSNILNQTADSKTLAEFLVANFRTTFTSASSLGIALPSQIVTAMSVGTVTTTVTPPVVAQPVSTNPPSSDSLQLSRNLKLGMSGADVRLLQQYLNTHGFVVAVYGAGSLGNETTYFGPATTAAVVKYQLSHNISPAVGFVGPITRASLLK